MTGDPEFDLFNSAYLYAFKRAIITFWTKELDRNCKRSGQKQRNLQNNQSKINLDHFMPVITKAMISGGYCYDW